MYNVLKIYKIYMLQGVGTVELRLYTVRTLHFKMQKQNYLLFSLKMMRGDVRHVPAAEMQNWRCYNRGTVDALLS